MWRRVYVINAAGMVGGGGRGELQAQKINNIPKLPYSKSDHELNSKRLWVMNPYACENASSK